MLAAEGTELIIEAQDMDKYRNANIAKGSSRIYLMAGEHGMECRRLAWNPNYKGIDDWRLALRKKERQREEEKKDPGDASTLKEEPETRDFLQKYRFQQPLRHIDRPCGEFSHEMHRAPGSGAHVL